MKSRFRLFLTVAILSIGAPSVALAQMVDPMKFTTSFAFTVGHTNFRPGSYTARPLDGDPSIICIQADHGGPAAFVVGMPEATPRHEPPTSEVTFVREGNRLVLKSLWDNLSSEGLDVLPTVTPVNAN